MAEPEPRPRFTGADYLELGGAERREVLDLIDQRWCRVELISGERVRLIN